MVKVTARASEFLSILGLNKASSAVALLGLLVLTFSRSGEAKARDLSLSLGLKVSSKNSFSSLASLSSLNLAICFSFLAFKIGVLWSKGMCFFSLGLVTKVGLSCNCANSNCSFSCLLLASSFSLLFKNPTQYFS